MEGMESNERVRALCMAQGRVSFFMMRVRGRKEGSSLGYSEVGARGRRVVGFRND